MKIKTYIVTWSDPINNSGISPHGTKAAAEVEFREMVAAAWDRKDLSDPMPTDAHEAYEILAQDLDNEYSYEIEEHEIDVPFPDFGPDIEAALCCWEWLLSPDRDQMWESVADGVGFPGMRMVSVHAGQIVLSVHDLMEARGLEFTYAYDFDFVPAVLEQLDWPTLVENNQYGDRTYRPDPAPMLDHMLKTMPDRFSDQWLDDAKREAKKQWAYEDLVSDHEDKIDRTETPAEWVKRIGEKYDLTPAGDW
ncbi:hypothetical protein [Rhizobium arsenicireducens]